MIQNSILLGCEPVQSIETWKMFCFYKRFKPKNCTEKKKLGLFSYLHITVHHPVCWVKSCKFFLWNSCSVWMAAARIDKFLHEFNVSGVWTRLTKKNYKTPFMLSCCGIFIFLHEGSEWCFLMIFIITFYLAVDPVEYNKNNNVLSILYKKSDI